MLALHLIVDITTEGVKETELIKKYRPTLKERI